LAQLQDKIDSLLQQSASASSDELEQLQTQERELEDDLARRRAAAVVLRQRLRSGVVAHGGSAVPAPQQELVKAALGATLSKTMLASTFRSDLQGTLGGAGAAGGAAGGGAGGAGGAGDTTWELKTSDFVVDRAAKLGSGAFGQVYRGTCRGKRVAIKELSGTFDGALLGAFRSEVQTLAALRHPNLILLMGACFEHGNLAIITEFMERGSVHDLLRDKKVVVSLKRRMIFAKDAALGMAWLHGATPAILHLDLKTANMLVDDTWTAKIGDFGLAQQKRAVNAGRVGSPVYMAPEMLQNSAFTEKADVFSFGVILWELFTKKEPYEGQFADVADLSNAVVNRESRPEMPADMPERLRALIEQCWAQAPSKRPSFAELCRATTLDDVVIDAHVSAPNQLARDLWRAKFGSKFGVSFRELVRQLCAALGVDAKSVAPGTLRADCLAAVLDVELNQQTGRDDDDGDVHDEVTLESFGRMLEWFGPLEKGEKLFQNIDDVLQLPGFFGDIATAAAEAALKADGKKGTYLIRFSSTPGSYAISLINKKGTLEHYRITHTPGQPYKMATSSFPSLKALIKTTHEDLYLKKALDGGKFQKMFASAVAKFQASAGYMQDF
jgi:hypothetical protein